MIRKALLTAARLRDSSTAVSSSNTWRSISHPESSNELCVGRRAPDAADRAPGPSAALRGRYRRHLRGLLGSGGDAVPGPRSADEAIRRGGLHRADSRGPAPPPAVSVGHLRSVTGANR